MISGILIINKPAGPTSHDIVDKIRKVIAPRSRISRPKGLRIGHAGTLDPFAEGVLIILIGRATKSQSRFMAQPKTYIATLRLGAISDTDDATGNIKRVNHESRIMNHEIKKMLKEFIGEIEQTPPTYSAVKIKGKKAYELARKGIKPKLKPRKVNIYNIKLLKYKYPYLEIQVECGKGTYIRSLARDIGQKLGAGAYLEKLTRTRIGEFDIKNSVKLDNLNSENLPNKIISVKI